MSFRRISLLAAALLLTASVAVTAARAQAPIKDFTLSKPDKSTLTLASLSGRKAVVVVFVNPVCPFSRLYQNRLNALASTYGGRGVEFLFVNALINMQQATSDLEADKLKVKVSGAELPTLTDDGQKTAILLGATKTPEAVVLQPVSGGFAVRYRGAIDDNPQVETDVNQRYLQTALDAVLAGQTAAIGDKHALGCRIDR